LKQLGTLIAIGMLLAAWGMLYLFLPVLLRINRRYPEKSKKPKFRLFQSKRVYPINVSRWATGLLLLLSIGILAYRLPRLDRSPDALRPKKSEASRTLAQLQAQIGSSIEPYWLMARGNKIEEVRRTLLDLEPTLRGAISSNLLASYNLPTELWPDPANQRANAPVLRALANDEAVLRQTAKEAGFADAALALTARVFSNWKTSGNEVIWPSGPIAEWLLPKFVARTGDGYLAMGLIYPGPSFNQAALSASLPSNVILSGWGLLGKNIFAHAMRELPLISGAIALIVIISLWLTFRTWRDVALSLSTLIFSGVILCGSMSFFGWQWNLLNLISVPLLIGMGVDYSIHIQLALHRYRGDRLKVRQSIGSALLLAGSTTIAGFASLSFSSNYGMATLGAVCGLGLTVMLLTAVYLLPSWWTRGDSDPLLSEKRDDDQEQKGD
jgi:predicted exporter